MRSKCILVTGGAGFIGSALIRYIVTETDHTVINLDKLTYAGNLDSLKVVENNERYDFVLGNICDQALVENVFLKYHPDYVMNLAAESHVDRSIAEPKDFIQSNIIGTYTLLEVARKYFSGLKSKKQNEFRFHHVSTDEVYGELGEHGLFTESSSYNPSSPYSASKAASDHLVRAWHRTYQLPTIISNSSNNYGPFQFAEKLIPSVILRAIDGLPITVYGNGRQVRDWLYVDDHVKALYKIVTEGVPGESYNVGGHCEKQNIEVVQLICDYLNKSQIQKPNGIFDFRELITYVPDRPGHDVRYAIDSTKIQKELGWKPLETFDSGLMKTIDWYLKKYRVTGNE